MATTPTTQQQDLLSVLRQTFPWVQSYELLGTVVQSNANGYIAKLFSGDGNDDATCDSSSDKKNKPSMVFIKRVIASDYVSTKKDWTDLRRTLTYARTESRFYANFRPILVNQQHGFGDDMVPHVYHASHSLSDWIGEDEPATAVVTAAAAADTTTIDKNTLPNAHEKGGLLILECISQDDYFQDSPLRLDQCRLSLAAVARLHAAAWQDVALLKQAQAQLSKASFHLSTRNPKELAGIVEAWENGFALAFRSDLEAAGLWDKQSVHDLGKRLFKVAKYVSQELSPQPNDPYATVIHGDYKSLNVFLPKDTSTGSTKKKNAVLVDYASTGIGLGMSDVAMHIHHCIIPSDLDNGGEEALVRHYWETLQAALQERRNHSVDPYPWDVAWRHYRLAVVDYGRFFMARMWKGATPETMAKRKDNKNVNLINRWPHAAMAYIQRLDTYLVEIEAEYEEAAVSQKVSES